MLDTMRRGVRSKIVLSNQKATAQADMVPTEKKNQEENFSDAPAPLSPKHMRRGKVLPGTKLPPIFTPTMPTLQRKDNPSERQRVPSSKVNQRRCKGESEIQRQVDSGTTDREPSKAMTILVNGSERASRVYRRDSSAKPTSSSEQFGEIFGGGGTNKCNGMNGRKQRENGHRRSLDPDHREQKLAKFQDAQDSRLSIEARSEVTKDSGVLPKTIRVDPRFQTTEGDAKDHHLHYKHFQLSFRAAHLRPVLPPIGGNGRPTNNKKPGKRGKKSSRKARQREKEIEWKLKVTEEDIILKLFLQSLAVNRRGATCVEIDKLFNSGMLVNFVESLALLSAMQWWL